jgi:hypothetical protein
MDSFWLGWIQYSFENAQSVAGEIRSQLANQGYGVIVNLFQRP